MGSNEEILEIVYLKNQQFELLELSDKLKSANYILAEANSTLMHNFFNGMNRQEVLEMHMMYYGVENLLSYMNDKLGENSIKMEGYITLLNRKIELWKK